MTARGTKEARKHRRISLDRSDGVYCIVVRDRSAGNPITLPAMDFSESGFRFAAVSHMVKDLSEGETFYLKAIAGSRNLAFKDPLALELKWRKFDISRTWVTMGCEIITISAEAKAQFLKFIEAEAKFRGIGRLGLSGSDSPKMETIPEPQGPQKEAPKPSKTFLTISGGSPLNGSLEKVLICVEDTLRACGHRVERVNLLDKVVKGCDGCGQCNDPENEPGCYMQDDAQWIIDKLISCDVAIYASPLYYWGFSSQLKALIDRCHSLFGGGNGGPKHPSFTKGQRQALIATTPDPFDNNAEPLLSIFHRMLGRCKAQSAGVLFVCNCSTPDILGGEIKTQSIKFAHNLLGSTRTPYPVLIPGVG